MSTRLQHSFNSLRKQVLYDNLTGLLSREGITEATVSPHTNQQATLMIIGLKAFSHINDSIGHLNGDQLLVLIARRLEKDLPDGALLSRVGRDEFAVFIPGIETHNNAELIADQLLAPFSFPFITNGVEVMVSASIGAVQGVLPQDGMAEWLRNASLALNKAKAQEDKPVHYFEPRMLEASLEKKPDWPPSSTGHWSIMNLRSTFSLSSIWQVRQPAVPRHWCAGVAQPVA